MVSFGALHPVWVYSQRTLVFWHPIFRTFVFVSKHKHRRLSPIRTWNIKTWYGPLWPELQGQFRQCKDRSKDRPNGLYISGESDTTNRPQPYLATSRQQRACELRGCEQASSKNKNVDLRDQRSRRDWLTERLHSASASPLASRLSSSPDASSSTPCQVVCGRPIKNS